MEARPSFTRRAPRRFTRPSVRIGDAVARFVITVGGIGTIAAVMGVCVFLAWVVWPLFLPPRELGTATVALKWDGSSPARLGVDESRLIGWVVEPAAQLRVFRLSDGHTLVKRPLVAGAEITAWSTPSPGSDEFAVGLADGAARVGAIHVLAEDLSADEAAQLANQQPGAGQSAPFVYQEGLIEQLGPRQFRYHHVVVEFADPLDVGQKSPLRVVDLATTIRGTQLAALGDDGSLTVTPIRQRENLLGASSGATAPAVALGYQSLRKDSPRHLLLSGANLFAVWSDGELARFDLRPRSPVLAETVDLLPDETSRVTALAPLVGRGAFAVGDSHGGVKAWFLAKPEGAETLDESKLVAPRDLSAHRQGVTALAASGRSRLVTAGYADGRLTLFQVTTGQPLLSVDLQDARPITALAIAPKEDALLAATQTGVSMSRVELNHPDATLASLFTPIWYQDYAAPAHVWQSSGGSEANEPKFGVMPLVFGTAKATFYSMLFAVPIALAAAVYTAEFLPRGSRGRVKPTIELMASLPSVVLGYLAAFVIAPFVARFVPAVLLSFLTLPAVFLLCAYLWQLLPERLGLRLRAYRFIFICLALPPGFWLAWQLGPPMERLLFEGNFVRWLDAGDSSPFGGWLLLLTPLAAIASGYFISREVTPRLRRASASWSAARCAAVDFVKFLLGATAALALAWLAALALARAGFDPRGIVFGSYIQRNAMIVGFAMGFAVIPIIYTIAEDALSSVPDHLRSASLGAGATPWQTTVRIIIPTAMSGLFSAIMIGLGRAVGETMIVLMAAGNTPIMDWNIFDGFRTLSANLAVELPEAEQGSSHFRILFLTALSLFALTFVINTVAEAVRQRFRRRAYQL